MTILTPAQVQEIEDNFDSKRVRTHWKDCWKCHPDCAIARLIASHRALEQRVVGLRHEISGLQTEVTELNQVLRDAGWGQGEIDSAASVDAHVEGLEAEATRLREVLEVSRKCFGAVNGSRELARRLSALSTAIYNCEPQAITPTEVPHEAIRDPHYGLDDTPGQ